MGEKPTSKRPPPTTSHKRRVAETWPGAFQGPPLSLVPVPFEDQYKRQPPVQQDSWWTFCTSRLHYHTIQVRWDIERWFARLFHRRWGG